ncbi:MAG: NAD-dependent epimerase/dehydratase family protein [Stagnimonas sp.]|nr:NAD-dependent epimerase/dehydratase family protein [Stagnimonas sp.]
MKTLVTGGSGFIGGHLVARLLADGHTVHATVRSVKNPAKVGALLALQRQYPGQLQLFEADLLKPASFTPAMAGCEVVHHVASPFLMPEKIKNGRTQMLEPALQGTENVLASVEACESVRRVVLTSTIGAVMGDYADVLQMEGQVLSERYFNTTSTVNYNPYHYSKVRAEQRAWQLSAQQSRWDLVCINPGLVLGPALSASSESGSLFLLDQLFGGHFFYGLPRLSFATVDVREVVAAHAAVAAQPSAKGRYIVASPEMISFLDIAKTVRPCHHRAWSLPRNGLPDGLMYLVGPVFGLSHRYLKNHLGISFKLDSQRSVDELSIRYRPVQQSLRDHYESWRQQKRVG